MTTKRPKRSERELADEQFEIAQSTTDVLRHEYGEPPRSDVAFLGWAQVEMLRAVYHELRHGHDQAAAHSAALVAHTKALAENTEMMDELFRGLLGDADPLGKPKSR